MSSQTTSPSWYDVLDVDPGASTDEVRAAWRAGIADLEPGSRRFASLNAAAEVLLDPHRRAAYDASLGEGAPVAAPGTAPDPTSGTVRDTQPDLVPDADGAPDDRESVTDSARTGRDVPTWLLAVLGLVVAALVAGCAWAWQATSGETEEEATRAAQAAAERAIVPVLSYGFETLEEDQARAQGYLTSDYREDYDQLFAVISDNAPQTETTVQAEVVASGIVRSGRDRVDVLVFVDRPTTNKLTPEPETYKDQVTVTMQRVGDEWLVDNLVTSPARR
ncbi:J domain-containing protein [Nocardioides sediminis]|uniref:J domain-containing protein n=1 Tax=Nocardioides sediminis TaxID=433648 RepID=UPI00131ED88C|nr:DnaJ domain-containing protein [Nocardioides sediminis]